VQCVGSRNSIDRNREDLVKCFVTNTTSEPLLLFDSFDSTSADELDSISKESSQLCWYHVRISDFKNNRFKISSIKIIPCTNDNFNGTSDKYVGKWMKSNRLYTHLQDYGSGNTNLEGIPLFENANLKSMVTHRITNLAKVQILAVDGTWAKVKYERHGNMFSGWLQKEHQCDLPYTTCNPY